jgi:cytochrome bd-type quinol oxidase subunit 2
VWVWWCTSIGENLCPKIIKGTFACLLLQKVLFSKVTQYVYKNYKVADPIIFNKRINERLAEIKKATQQCTAALLGFVLAAVLLWFVLRKQVHLQTAIFVFALLFALVLLLVGSLVPVIEVDARIQSLDLLLLGEKVRFQNQVLFYQSKSILGIVETLIGQPKPDAIIVGVLICMFILLLPLVRLVAKGIHVLNPKLTANNKCYVTLLLNFINGIWPM